MIRCVLFMSLSAVILLPPILEINSLKVKLLFFATCRDIIGVKEMDYEVDNQATLSGLKRQLCVDYPELKPLEKTLSLAVNTEYVDDSVRLCCGDEVAFIPPVSGG